MNLKSVIYAFQFKLRQCFLGHYYSTAESNVPLGDDFAPKHLVFILAGLIGDSVMSYPAISEARRAWPDAFIAVVGKSHNRDLLAGCSDFDEFYVCDTDPFSFRGRSAVKALQKWITAGNFDTSIILLGDQYAHLLAKAGIPVRVGVKGTTMEKCLTHVYDIGSPRTWGVKERLRAIQALGVSSNPQIPYLKVCRDENTNGLSKLYSLGLKENEKYAVLHPFGSTRRQWWALPNLTPLSEWIYSHLGYRTVLIGGGETSFPFKIGYEMVDTRGKLSLRELLAVIHGSEFVVTTDSGPFHIAGALGKPIVGLFRDRRPEHANAYPNGKVVFGYDSRCKNECEWDKCVEAQCRQMMAIDVPSVLDAISRVVKG